ncbi:MAG: precorrin-2 dehydrogenase/sirohydrochlorin ferrochelatase family protein [Nitrospirota bacterium]
MKYYPVFLDVRGRRCTVVGGGQVAERKAVSLFDAGADLAVISPSLTPALAELAGKGKITHHSKQFDETDLAGAYLVIAATNDAAVNEAVARACRKAGILVNAATSPDEGTFVVPSVVERGDLLIAISTCGDSPALARKVREDLERSYGPEYGVFLEKMALLRRRLLHGVSEEMRRKIYQAVVDSDVLYLLKAGQAHEADHRIAEIVHAVSGTTAS